MHSYTPREFNLPTLDGISPKSVEEHLGLYKGYVKNFNAISNLLPEYAQDSEKHAHVLSELIRRRSFEFDGMRLHELYFEQLEDTATTRPVTSTFATKIEEQYQKFEYFLAMFRAIALMRGPGWAILYWDPVDQQFLTGFSGEQHQGHFVTLPVILALDVWEHAYLLDHGAQGKGKYIDAFFKNLNWAVVENRFASLNA